jgi:dolichol-phosphate mannosyltransferase
MTQRFIVLLPTYNERENLARIVPMILAQDARLEVLVIDDSSPDGTGRLAEEMAQTELRVHVLHRKTKEGLGRAYLAGFAWAVEKGYDLVFEMDSDFSHDPRYLRDLIAASADADLVVGSRYKKGVNVINWPMSRLMLSYFASVYARTITRLAVLTTTSSAMAEGVPRCARLCITSSA